MCTHKTGRFGRTRCSVFAHPSCLGLTSLVRTSIAKRLLVGAIVVATLPLLLLTVVLVMVNQNTVREQARMLHMASAADLARTLDEGRQQAAHDLLAVAQALTLRSLDSDARLALASSLLAGGSLDRVDVWSAAGEHIDALTRDGGNSVEKATAVPSGEWPVGEVRAGTLVPPTGPEGARLWLWVPLVGAAGQRTGYVAAPWALAALQQRVEQVAVASFPGYPHSVFVTYGDRIVAHVQPSLAASLSSASAEPIAAGVLGIGEAGRTAGFSTSAQGTRIDGVDVVGSAVTSGPFIAVAQMPKAIVDAPVRRIVWAALASLVVALVFAFVMFRALSRSITVPAATLMTHTKALAARMFGHRSEVKTGDELEALAGALNQAGHDLAVGEERLLEETRLRDGLARFLPEQLVSRFVSKELAFRTQGERRDTTIMFVDICAFTPLTESMSPEDLTALLNDVFTILTDIVWRHGGVVDKFVGDSMMALWGAPVADDQQADRAVEAASDMMRFLEVGNARWHKRYGRKIELAIGVASGSVVVGNMGTDRRMVYTAIGLAVNTAARLESVAGPMQILISDQTKQALRQPQNVRLQSLGANALTGLSSTIDVWAVEV
jgi:adenylate cyclase